MATKVKVNPFTLWRGYIVPPNGEAKRVKSFNGKDFEFEGKTYKAPNINEINRMWLGAFKQKVVMYSEGSATPIPIAGLKHDPRSYGPDDVQTIEGGYAVQVVRDAIQDERKLETLIIVSLIVAGLALVLCITNAVLIYKLGKAFHAW